MSFLASLRQPAEVEKPLSLCYLLSIDRDHQQVHLALALGRVREARIIELQGSYHIQRQHLQQLPPFVAEQDRGLLQALLDNSPRWLDANAGELPATNFPVFLKQLLESRRCFMDVPAGGWQLLELGPTVTVAPRWWIAADGRQVPRWRCQQDHTVIFRDGESSRPPFVWQSNAGLISPGQTPLEPSTVREFNLQPALHTSDVAEFLQQHSTSWGEAGLPLPEALPTHQCEPLIRPRLRCLAAGSGKLERLQLVFCYHSALLCCEIDPETDTDQLSFLTQDGVLELTRDTRQEQHHLDAITPLLVGFRPLADGGEWRAITAQSWRTLLLESRSALAELGCDICIQPGFRYHYVQAGAWQVEINALEDSCDIGIQVQVGQEWLQLLPLLKQLRQEHDSGHEGIYTLDDGRLLLIDAQTLGSLIDEFGALPDRSHFRLPRSQLGRLHNLQQQLPGDANWHGDLALLKQANDLHGEPIILNSPPRDLNAELRPYQWLGVCWLQHLQRHRVNGLLADDMGLGKTLQTLAHLCLEQQSGRLQEPALIVAPTSLLHNWASEAQRFAPTLSSLIIHGPSRHRHWQNLTNFKLLITSYPLLVNDLDHWRSQSLSWLILDEAQHIKNPRTKVRRAFEEMDCAQRLCLSGTPVENHLGELRSILDFLMPNCLGGEREFKYQYQRPIEREGDTRRMQQLMDRIAPYILRRDKNQVAADLPRKNVIQQTLDMAEDQRDFYQQLKDQNWQDLQTSLKNTENVAQQQVLLLNGLLKLRQACCDPALLDKTGISSAKRQHCLDMIESLVAENRALLVFSQFTQMLDLLAEDLEKMGIPYLMLTGQSRHRQELVDDFQQGRAPVFLISLKAGGVGLNLTRADTVIHYDPWWNQAAEQQATDRAHRIGQDKPVFVYKLIIENSIEERIFLLQQRKALLGHHINRQGQLSAEHFSLKLEELLALWHEE